MNYYVMSLTISNNVYKCIDKEIYLLNELW